MGSVDSAFLLEERPGNHMYIGCASTGLQTAEFNFDDTAIAHSIAYWRKLLKWPCWTPLHKKNW